LELVKIPTAAAERPQRGGRLQIAISVSVGKDQAYRLGGPVRVAN
jgi:hypothetical protein